MKNVYVVGEVTTIFGRFRVTILDKAPKGSNKYDIIALDFRNHKNGKKLLMAMTPKEAVMFGISLIQASALGNIRILKNNPKDADWATNWESAFTQSEEDHETEIEKSTKT